jgi:hypothetical protein
MNDVTRLSDNLNRVSDTIHAASAPAYRALLEHLTSGRAVCNTIARQLRMMLGDSPVLLCSTPMFLAVGEAVTANKVRNQLAQAISLQR